jgi:ATP-binding cassette subfamily B protein
MPTWLNGGCILKFVATSALDTSSEAIVPLALERLMAGLTTFIIAHRHAILRRANRLMALEKGLLTILRSFTEPNIKSAGQPLKCEKY